MFTYYHFLSSRSQAVDVIEYYLTPNVTLSLQCTETRNEESVLVLDTDAYDTKRTEEYEYEEANRRE